MENKRGRCSKITISKDGVEPGVCRGKYNNGYTPAIDDYLNLAGSQADLLKK
jgi:hypothetical protein